jgi:Flp pilus assembly protein TadD
MRAFRRTAIFVAVALVACGGASPPAQTGASTPPAAMAAPVETSATLPESAPSADLMAGIKAFDAGNYADARKSFEAAAKKNAKDFQALYNLGMACEKLGDKPAAEGAYKSALALKPDLESAAVELCALYVDEGRIDDALATARPVLAKHPANAALHENVGVALATRGDQEDATHELEEAIKGQPSEPMYQLTLAHWLNVWHVAGGAAPHLDAARDLVKDDYGMVASVGHEYRMGGAFDSCIKTFDRAIQMKDGGEVRTERALCRLGIKDEKGMLEDLQAAVAREPSYPVAHYYLGSRFERMKRFKDAAVEFAKYLELAPNGSLSKLASERLKGAQDAAKAGGLPARKK